MILRRIIVLLFILCLRSIDSEAHQKVLNLIAVDQINHQQIQNAYVFVDGKLIGSTNRDGIISLELVIGDIHTIKITHLSYIDVEFRVDYDGRDSIIVYLNQRIGRLSDIVVFSSPTGSGVQYQAGNVIGTQSLIHRSDVSLGSMLDGEPGVTMRSMGPAATRPIIRGLDGDRILILENGLRMGDISGTAADHTIAMDPSALERVEIVRGPSSLLYGSSAIGGVINMRTADIPGNISDPVTGSFKTMYSSVNDLLSLSARVSGRSGKHSYTSRISSKNAGDIRTPTLRIPGTDVNSLEYAIGYGFANTGLDFGTAISGISGAYGIPVEPESDESVHIKYTRNAVQGQLELVSSGRIHKHELKYNLTRFDQQELVFEANEFGVTEDNLALAYDLNSANVDYRLHHGKNIFSDQGIIGITGLLRKYEVSGDDAFTPGDVIRSFSLYTFQERALIRNLTSQVGLRLDSRWLKVLENEANPGINEDRTDLNLAYSVGINYKIGKFDLAFQFARSHRQIGVEELFSFGPHLGAGVFEIGDPDLETEISTGFDMMIKYSADNIRMELSLFHNAIHNFVMFAPQGFSDMESGLPVFAYNSTRAVLRGYELELEQVLTDHWTSKFSLDYVRGSLNDVSGEPLPMMPPLRVNVQLNYNTSNFWSGIQFRNVFDQSRVAENEYSTPGYRVVQINTGYRIGKDQLYSIHFRIDNLFNEKYRDHLTRMETRNYLMPGRSFNLIFSMNF